MKLAVAPLLKAQWQYQPGAPHDPNPPVDLQGWAVTAEPGAFTFTGQAATLAGAFKIAADAASFALSGQDAGLKFGGVVTAAAGSFAFTGQDAGLSAARRIAADAVAFALTGQDAGFVVTHALAADAGTFAISGQDASLTYAGASVPPVVLPALGGGGPAPRSVQKAEDERRRRNAEQQAALRRAIEEAYDKITGLVVAEEAAEPEAPEPIVAEIPAAAVEAIEVAQDPAATVADLREVLAVLRQVQAALLAEQDDEEALLLAA